MRQINNSQNAFELLRSNFNPLCEEFWLITLNAQLYTINTTLISRGTLNFCLVHPRDIFRCAVHDNALSLILAHNHPSLALNPSNQDIQLTKKLIRISKIIEIPIIDHLIFSSEFYFSFKENNLL
jgi:DNA repair protein RadC